MGEQRFPKQDILDPDAARGHSPSPFLYPLATPFMAAAVEWLFVNCNLAIGPPRASPQEREDEGGWMSGFRGSGSRVYYAMTQ